MRHLRYWYTHGIYLCSLYTLAFRRTQTFPHIPYAVATSYMSTTCKALCVSRDSSRLHHTIMVFSDGPRCVSCHRRRGLSDSKGRVARPGDSGVEVTPCVSPSPSESISLPYLRPCCKSFAALQYPERSALRSLVLSCRMFGW
jgi:hypothetical protein